MKKKIICILAVATALTGAQPAQAGKKERYLIGGLLGGWFLNNAVSHSIHDDVRHHPFVQIRSRTGYCSPVIVERSRYHRRPSGRYETRRVKMWIPGHYDRAGSRCGRGDIRWVPGRYDVRTERVWVSYGSRRSRSHAHDRYAWH